MPCHANTFLLFSLPFSGPSSGVLLKNRVGISPYMLETRRRGLGVLGDGCPPPSRLEGLGECPPVPRHHILGIFQGLRSFLVETMHYRVYGIVKCEKLLAVPSANEVYAVKKTPEVVIWHIPMCTPNTPLGPSHNTSWQYCQCEVVLKCIGLFISPRMSRRLM